MLLYDKHNKMGSRLKTETVAYFSRWCRLRFRFLYVHLEGIQPWAVISDHSKFTPSAHSILTISFPRAFFFSFMKKITFSDSHTIIQSTFTYALVPPKVKIFQQGPAKVADCFSFSLCNPKIKGRAPPSGTQSSKIPYWLSNQRVGSPPSTHQSKVETSH